MNVRKSDVFIADLERQFEWYVLNAGQTVADRYLDAVEGTCNLLDSIPNWGLRFLLSMRVCAIGDSSLFFALSKSMCFSMSKEKAK